MASNSASKGRRQQYSILPETELLPLQDMRLDDPSNLANDDSILPSSDFRGPISHDYHSASKDGMQRHDYGGFAPVPELGFPDNLQESDEICPLCGGEVATKSQKPKRPSLFPTLFPKTSQFLRQHQQYFVQGLRGSRFHGWRMGVLFGCCMSTLVLFCNIALVIVGYKRNNGYDDHRIATLMTGGEHTISRWNTILHLFINMLSSVLLASSNYTMQVLSSPTREEIDRAHQYGHELEVGILSTRNLTRISRKRAIVCVILALSSIPLHLFYNAATFKVIANNAYKVFAIDIDSDDFKRMNQTGSGYRLLENGAWRSVYGGQFVSGYGDVYLCIDQILINANATAPQSVVEYLPWTATQTISNFTSPDTPNPDWIPYEAGTFHNVTGGSDVPKAMHVLSALAYQTGSQSRIQISFPYMMVVIAFNLLKLCIMAGALIGIRSNHMVTLGDAIASFLGYPDSITRGSFPQDGNHDARCMIKVQTPRVVSSDERGISVYTQTTTLAKNIPYSDLVQDDKTVFFFFLSMACLILLLTVFATSSDSLNTGGNSWLWGTASEAALLIGNSGGTGIFNAWLANFPQVLLSLCYVNLNTLCTAMAGAAEWNKLGDPSERKTLRVTAPKGSQRGTYFLQLPYRWALPLVSVSWMLHWLLSQSFFLVRIDRFDGDGDIMADNSKSACGVSLSSLVTFFAVGLALYVTVRSIGEIGMIPRLPPAGSSSLMISAACHPPPSEDEPHQREVSWGLITQKHPPFTRYYSLSGDAANEQSYGPKSVRMRGPQRVVVQKGVQSTVPGAAINPGFGIGS